MTSAFQRNGSRFCSRCGATLEDPASEERGVGPVCAGKDTVLFSRTIPANYAGATAILLSIQEETLPEAVQLRFMVMKSNVVMKARMAALANDETGVIHLGGQDLRPIIKELDWLLSHKINCRLHLIKVVKFLGYAELAAVLSREASTTTAPLWFQDGRVFLKGKSCKSGFYAMRGIPGTQVPRYRGDERPFSAPANEVEKFLSVVTDFWPLYTVVTPQQETIADGTLNTIRQQAQEWLQQTSEALQAQKATTPTSGVLPATAASPTAFASHVATICQRTRTTGKLQGEVIQVRFQWNFEQTQQMSSLIAKFKELPKTERSYDPDSKSWFFKPQHKNKVVDALKPLFAIKEEVVDNRICS